MNEKQLWTIAAASQEVRREASFGGGRFSTTTNNFKLCWDPCSEAFVTGAQYGVGSWAWTSHPCCRVFAESILALCKQADVQSQFLEDRYADKDLQACFMCDDRIVGFQRNRALRDEGIGFYALASFSFSFYDADWNLQHVDLGPNLTARFVHIMKVMDVESIREQLGRIPVGA